MEHVCKHESEIGSFATDITNLKRDNLKRDDWQTRIEDKIDKILYFFLGQSVGIIASIVVAVIIYFINT